MSEGRSTPGALTRRQRFWLEHLDACREQRKSLKAYAREHDLSVSALYAAKASLKRRGAVDGAARSRPAATLVPVRLSSTPAVTLVRVLLPNGVIVEVPDTIEPERCRALLASAGAVG